ncbi:MAG TPA: hypothetical protein VFO54_01650 [Chryseosolibacter sp.]|nr:hypothetical protein [Chryseosolibacter sp.]
MTKSDNFKVSLPETFLFMKVLNKLYQYINILSLDVVAGAVISTLFFARVLHVTVSHYVLTALALTVWIIYTIDHLRDARAIRNTALTDRHRFHQKHFKAILTALIFVLVVDSALILFVPYRVLLFGLFLWSVVLAYLILQRYLKFFKEFFVALLYTAGILLPVFSSTTSNLEFIHFILIGKFFITALMNLLLFSLFDYKDDRHQKQHSFVTWFGPASTRLGILFLGLLNISSGLFLWSFDPRVAMIFISMNLMLLAILFLKKQLVANNYYRILGDSVFFFPVFYLL